MKYFLSALFFVVLLLQISFADFLKSTPVGPGIIHHHQYLGAGPWHLHVLEIDKNNTFIQFETVKANDLLYGNISVRLR